MGYVIVGREPLWSKCCSCVVAGIIGLVVLAVLIVVGADISDNRARARNKVVVEASPNMKALLVDPAAEWRPGYIAPTERMVYYPMWVRITNDASQPIDVEATAFFMLIDNEDYSAVSPVLECQYRVSAPMPEGRLDPGYNVSGNILVPVPARIVVPADALVSYKSSSFDLFTVVTRKYSKGN